MCIMVKENNIMSIDLIEDIDLLKESLILIREGASDEKEMGFDLLQNLITKKEILMDSFEQDMQMEQEALSDRNDSYADRRG